MPGALGAASVLAALTALAKRLGVEVRVETFVLQIAGKGGLCHIDGRAVVLLDAKLPVVEQVGILGRALGAMGPKNVPASLAPYLATGHGAVRPLLRPRPLARSGR